MPIQTKQQSMETRLAVLEDKVVINFAYIEKSFDSFNKKMDSIETKQDEINLSIQNQRIIDQQHYFNCPNTKRLNDLDSNIKSMYVEINTIKDENGDKNIAFRFFRKYPFVFIGIIALASIIGTIIFKSYIGENPYEARIDRLEKHDQFWRDPNEKPNYRGGTSANFLDQKSDSIK